MQAYGTLLSFGPCDRVEDPSVCDVGLCNEQEGRAVFLLNSGQPLNTTQRISPSYYPNRHCATWLSATHSTRSSEFHSNVAHLLHYRSLTPSPATQPKASKTAQTANSRRRTQRRAMSRAIERRTQRARLTTTTRSSPRTRTRR